jgi:hypothetical protein
MEHYVSEALHPSAPHHLPGFITAPGDTDTLTVVVGIILIAAVLGVGNFYLHLHTMPERMAHKSQKLQFEIVAVLCLLAGTLSRQGISIGCLLTAARRRSWTVSMRCCSGRSRKSRR